MRNANKKLISSSLCLLFIVILFANVLKISYGDNVFLKQSGDLGLLYKLIFWVLCGFYILIGSIAFSLNVRAIFLFSLLLLMIVSIYFNINNFIFWLVLIFWGVSSNVLSNARFKLLYLFLISLIIVVFFTTSLWNNGSFFYDVRYGMIATFGFENPNSFPQLLVILYLLLASSIFRAFFCSVAFFSLALIFTTIHTRSFYLLILIFPFIFLFLKFSGKINKLAVLYPTLLIVVTLFVTYNAGEFSYLNKLLSGRLYFSSLAIADMDSVQKIIFGMPDMSDVDYPLDVSYVSVYHNHGLFGILLILFLYTKSIIELQKHKNIKGLAIIIGFLSYAVVENVLINLTLNFSLYYIFMSISKKRTQTELFK